MEPHLRPVSPVDSNEEGGPAESGGGDGESNGAKSPARARPRPKYALPTDRMKFDAQKEALSVISIVSDYGKRGVSSADMAARMNMAPTTAGLNNTFFFESGLVERAGKGRYKSTEAANKFAQKYSFNPDEAGAALRERLSTTWYFEIVNQQIGGFGPTPKEKLIELLAYEAETTKDYRVQLGSLLAWLEYAGLVELNDGQYKLAPDAPQHVEKAEVEPKQEKPAPTPAPAGSTTPRASSGQAEQSAETILGFNFDFALTGEQLAKLSPAQITALFQAVGEVMALKAEAEK